MITILATGFGAFPRVRNNPSAALVNALRARRAHFSRLEINLETCVLPVVYDGLKTRVATLVENTAPQAVLHFGVAAERELISIELYARDRIGSRRPDMHGARPCYERTGNAGEGKVAVRIPAAQIAARIARAGIAVELSQDAGAYLCNALLLETLTSHKDVAAGFIHIPLPSRSRSSRPSFDQIVKAADIALVAVAAHVRQISILPAAPPAL